MGYEYFPLKDKRIWVCGHRGMVGAALLRRLNSERAEILIEERYNLDLTQQFDVFSWLRHNRPDAVIVAAAKVGGIYANANFPVSFLEDNLSVALNVISGAAQADVPRLMFLASSCIYPRNAAQPLRETSLLTGALEPTNQWYAMAKIAGLKLAEAYHRERGLDYFTAVPANLYGAGDNYDPAMSHVIPGLIRRMHEAKLKGLSSVSIWGSGRATREFMHVDDCADALVHLLKNYQGGLPINVGVGSEVSIKDLAEAIASVTGYQGKLEFDVSKPDGMPRKSLDGTRLARMGWRASWSLEEGLSSAYRHFLYTEAVQSPVQDEHQILARQHG